MKKKEAHLLDFRDVNLEGVRVVWQGEVGHADIVEQFILVRLGQEVLEQGLFTVLLETEILLRMVFNIRSWEIAYYFKSILYQTINISLEP